MQTIYPLLLGRLCKSWLAAEVLVVKYLARLDQVEAGAPLHGEVHTLCEPPAVYQ